MFGLSLSTALMGAFVAGNDAGKVYGTWPRMGTNFIPSDLIDDNISPIWKNAFEHPTMVQFIHRNSAYATIIASMALMVYSRHLNTQALLSMQASLASHVLCSMSLAQAGLGVAVLTSGVSLPLASLPLPAPLVLPLPLAG